MLKSKRLLAVVLSCIMMFAMFAVPVSASAAAKPKLNKTKATVIRTKTIKLTLKNVTASKVSWSSSKKSVATVNQKGKVTGKKIGKATITAKYNGKKYKCKVTVKGRTIKKGTFSLYRTQTTTLKLKSGSKVMKVKSWKSSNKKVATISSKGVVTAKKVGSTTITCTDTHGDMYKATVKVKDPSAALKNYLIKNGKIDTDGYYYVGKTYYDEKADNYYKVFITYDSVKKQFEFESDSAYEEDTYVLFMDIPYNLTKNAPLFYFNMVSETYTTNWEAYASINPATYTLNNSVYFELYDGSDPEDNLQGYGNIDLRASIRCWNLLLNDKCGFGLKALGFSKL